MAEPLMTQTCGFELDPRGFIRAALVMDAEIELAHAKENVAALAQLSNGRRMPVLVDSRGIRSETRDAREHLVSEEAEKVTAAVALLVGSPVSRMLGSFFLQQHLNERIPTRMFTDEVQALAWLLTFAEADQTKAQPTG
ncbi:MAG: DUF7793 family protein [Myxococcaceae bacterium]